MSLRIRSSTGLPNDRKQEAPVRMRRRKDDVTELCEDVLKDMATDVVLDDEALALVRKTGQAFVDKLMKDAKLVSEHAGRDEITAQDVQLVLRLREA